MLINSRISDRKIMQRKKKEKVTNLANLYEQLQSNIQKKDF